MPYSKPQLASALDSHDKALVEWAKRRKKREQQIQAALKALPADADKEQQLKAYADLKQQWFDELESDLERRYIQQDIKRFLPRLLAENSRNQPTSCFWLKQKCHFLQHKQQQEAPGTLLFSKPAHRPRTTLSARSMHQAVAPAQVCSMAATKTMTPTSAQHKGQTVSQSCLMETQHDAHARQ